MSTGLLRHDAPWRVLDGFGRAVNAACRYAAPRTADELATLLARARAEDLPVAFRGAGRSYGDAALNARGLVVDLTGLDRVHSWDPVAGVIDAGPGLTIEGLWRRTIEDGYWPAVVPGTMFPTLGGCVSMNIHGKNNFRAGPFGDHVLELDLLTAGGELLRCSREENADVFHAVIGGMGLLGAVTRVKLRLKKVETGLLRVRSVTTRTLPEMFDCFEEWMPQADYCVGWVDCIAGGLSLGRGQVHIAHYTHADEIPHAQATLHVENQGLPPHIMGVPRSILWHFMAAMTNDPGMAFINAGKYHSSWLEHGKSALQSHVAFAFLLDYVPNWRLAYGPDGFIQYQIFVPDATARQCMVDVLKICRDHDLPSYLGVLKRHRPDPYLLTHALDGWSMAMDFAVPDSRRDRVLRMTEKLTDRVLAAGGKFYFAKDAVLRPEHIAQAYGAETLQKFAAIKQRLDPQGVLRTDLARRVGLVPAA